MPIKGRSLDIPADNCVEAKQRQQQIDHGWDAWVNAREDAEMQDYYEMQLLESLQNLKLANGEPP